MRSPFEDRYFPSNCASVKREKWLPSTCPHTWHLKRSSYLQIRRISDHPKPTNLLIIFSKWVANQKKNFCWSRWVPYHQNKRNSFVLGWIFVPLKVNFSRLSFFCISVYFAHFCLSVIKIYNTLEKRLLLSLSLPN